MHSSGPRRRRLSSAHVISFIALFVALGGGAYAAIAAKNTVNSKSVVDNSLLGTDVKNGKLAGIDVKDNGLTGKDVKEGTLGVVPNATNAANAALLGGTPAAQYVTRAAVHPSATSLSDSTSDATPVTTELDSAGSFTVTAVCNRAGANVTGQVVIKSSAAPWSVDSKGPPPGGNDNTDRVGLSALAAVILVGFGPTNTAHIGQGSFSAHDGTTGISGIASAEVNHAATAGRCDFAYSRFGS